MGLDIYFCSGADDKYPVWHNSVDFHNHYWLERWLLTNTPIRDLNEDDIRINHTTLAYLIATIRAVLADPSAGPKVLPNPRPQGCEYDSHYLQQISEAERRLQELLDNADPKELILVWGSY